MKSYLLIFIIITCLAVGSFGNATFYTANYTDILQSAPGARAAGMGFACTALAENAASAHVNPAGIAFADKKIELASNYSNLFNDVDQNIVNEIAPFWNGMAGLCVARSQVSDIPYVQEVNQRPDVSYYFNSVKQATVLTYGQKLSEQVGIGINFKYYAHELDQKTANGFGFDMGIQYKVDNFKAGFCWRNILGTAINWSTGHHDQIYPFFAIGIAADLNINDRKITTVLDMALDNDNSNAPYHWHYGAEYWLVKDLLALRAGIYQENLTLGLGLAYAGFKLDYAYIGHKDLGASNQVSTAFSF
ncbi:MAG: PorV/PorQ family protein [Candidatus Margulisiibacteriota bacterium]